MVSRCSPSSSAELISAEPMEGATNSAGSSAMPVGAAAAIQLNAITAERLARRVPSEQDVPWKAVTMW